MKYFQLVILAVCLCAMGCHTAPRTYDKKSVEKYFEKLPVGAQVSKIEKDLKLPEPRDTWSPQPGETGWYFRYWAHGLVIGFKASGHDNRYKSDYVYLGNFDIITEQEHIEILRQKLEPHDR